MFEDCSSLAELNLNNFRTSKAINMKNMFSSCRNLENLTKANFDTASVTNINNMFSQYSALIY